MFLILNTRLLLLFHVAGEPCKFSQDKRPISCRLCSAVTLFSVSLIKLMSLHRCCLQDTFYIHDVRVFGTDPDVLYVVSLFA